MLESGMAMSSGMAISTPTRSMELSMLDWDRLCTKEVLRATGESKLSLIRPSLMRLSEEATVKILSRRSPAWVRTDEQQQPHPETTLSARASANRGALLSSGDGARRPAALC